MQIMLFSSLHYWWLAGTYHAEHQELSPQEVKELLLV